MAGVGGGGRVLALGSLGGAGRRGISFPVLVHLLRGEGRRLLTGHVGQSSREAVDVALLWLDRNLDGLSRWLLRQEDVDEEDGEEAVRLLAAHVDVSVSFPNTTPLGKNGTSVGAAVALALLLEALRPAGVRLRSAGGAASLALVGVSGEVNVRGQLLPVLGVADKLQAARRAGCQLVVLPSGNAVDVEAAVAEAGGEGSEGGRWVRKSVVLADDLLQALARVLTTTGTSGLLLLMVMG